MLLLFFLISFSKQILQIRNGDLELNQMEMGKPESEPESFMVLQTVPLNVDQKNTKFYGKLFSSNLTHNDEQITYKKKHFR